jgi:hypothetical protein
MRTLVCLRPENRNMEEFAETSVLRSVIFPLCHRNVRPLKKHAGQHGKWKQKKGS